MARPTLAADPERVALLLPGCELPGVNGAELRRAFALDLQPEGLVLAPAGELSPERDLELRVEAACPTPDLLSLRAERGAERQSRTLRLSELALEQRPRALSLALSELVSLVLRPPPRREEPAAPPPAAEVPAPPPEPVQAPPPAAPPAAPTKKDVTPESDEVAKAAPIVAWRLGLAPELRFFPGTLLWGGALQLEHRGWRFGAGLLMARSAASSGAVWTRLVHGRVGYAFSLLNNAGGSTLESGPRGGFGHTFMSVQPQSGASGHDARDWYLDAAWTARYSFVATGGLRLGLGAEVGYARGPIGYADNVRIAQTSGPFASLAFDGSLPF